MGTSQAKVVEFTEVFRQKSDPEFITILDAVRNKDLAMPIEMKIELRLLLPLSTKLGN